MSHSGPVQLLDGTVVWFSDGEEVARQLLDGTVVWFSDGEEVDRHIPARLLSDDMPTVDSFLAAVPLANADDYGKFCDDWIVADYEKREKIFRYLADEAALNAEAKRAHEEALAKSGFEPKGKFDDFADQLEQMTIDVPEDEESKQ